VTQQQPNLNPTDKVPITLEAQQWNVVLMALAEAPFKISAPLIEAIRGQCMTYERETIDAMPAPAGGAPDA
jgi:hypothetical protein